MMEISHRRQQCRCVHQDANILHSLLKQDCQNHADMRHTASSGVNDNNQRVSSYCHSGNGQPMPPLLLATSGSNNPAFHSRDSDSVNHSAVSMSRGQGLAAMSRDLLMRKTYGGLVTADPPVRDYHEQLIAQKGRDDWQDRQRHRQQQVQPPPRFPAQQNVGYFQQQQQRPEQQRTQQHVHNQHVEMYKRTYAVAQRTHDRVHPPAPLPVPIPSPHHPRSQPSRSPPVIDRYPPVTSLCLNSFQNIDDYDSHSSRSRSSSMSSHLSTGRSSFSSSISSQDSGDDVDSGYSSSSSASPCGAVAEADARHPSRSPNVREVDTCDHTTSTMINDEIRSPDSDRLFRMLQSEKPGTGLEVTSGETRPYTDGFSTQDVLKEGRTAGVKRSRETYSTPEQDAPMDLTCKRSKLDSSFPLNFNGRSDGAGDRCKMSIQHPTATVLTKKEPWSFLDDEKKINANNNINKPRSLIDGSMLKSLLYGSLNDTRSSLPDDQSSRSESPATPPPFATGNTRVTIAKKTLLPVSARVSDWLLKIVQFAKSLPEYNNLCHNDKVTLLLTAWPRLLLLQMAETNFQFAVTPVIGDTTGSGDVGGRTTYNNNTATSSAETPTMSAVEKVQAFIKKCQSMTLDAQEYTLLKSATLFNTGYSGGIDDVKYVEEVNSCVRQALQDHIRVSRQGEMLRYSQVLMCLPTLFGINCKMVENLFCKHITGSMDVDVLLKEMLTRKID